MSAEREQERGRIFARRALVLGGLQLVGFGGIVARLHHLQVEEADRYRLMAEDNRINVRLLAPSRGPITDRFGVQIARNEQDYRLLLTADRLSAAALDELLARLASFVTIGETDLARVREERGRGTRGPTLIRANLAWEDVARLEYATPDLPGLAIEVGETRGYPFGEATAHLAGYVGAVSPEEVEAQPDQPVLRLPGFKIGKSGIERQQDAALRGVAGTVQLEVNAVGRTIRELARDSGRPGREVQLTLDVGLQIFTHDRLALERSASAVVMDVHTGDVFAIGSSPAYDPNVFAKGIPSTLWQSLSTDLAAPLRNKAIAGEYPPGSTFKMITGLAGLENGIGLDHTVGCPGYTALGSYIFRCWKAGGHGRVNLVSALAQSCDCYFYDIGRRIGIDAIAATARRFGFGSRIGVDLPGERPGLMPTVAWKRENRGEEWNPGENLVCSIGQGYVTATPLQLVTMTARLVNGGRAVLPRLTRSVGGEPTPVRDAPPMNIDPEHLAALLRGMEKVTDGGTASRSQIPEPEFRMGGKTGTSQVRRITAAERARGVRNETLPWHHRHHALFVGYAPIQAPRYACAVVVEHGVGGSKAAAPIARDLLWEAQKRDPALSRQQAALPDTPGTAPL